MANSASHSALPYPIKGARFTLQIPYLDADGDPTDPTTPDTEISKDGGSFADCAEEATTISGSNGAAYITLSGAEMDCSMAILAAKVASGPKATLIEIYPRALASIGTGTLAAGSAGGGTLGTILAYDLTGCFVRTTGGTGGGGTGGANNQVRKIATYTPSTGAFTVVPNWETTPDATTTYEIHLPEGVTLGMLKTLNPTTAGRTLDVSAGGEAGLDWSNIGSPSTSVNLSGTNIDTDQIVASVSGPVGSIAANGITAASIATGAVDADAIAADAVAELQNGLAQQASLDTVATNVTDIQETVGYKMSGSVDDLSPATTSFLSTIIGAQDDFYKDMYLCFKSGASNFFQRKVVTSYNGTTGEFTFDEEWPLTIVDGDEFFILSTHVHSISQVAGAVWDEGMAGHLTAGSTGEKLNAAGSAGDPWITELPGDYEAGTAGYIIGQNIDAQISDIIGGPRQTIIMGGKNCSSVQRLDAGEINPIGAQLVATTGTFTISEVTCTFADADNNPLYGILNAAATGFDVGALQAPRAWFELDTVDPPEDGPIAPGTYKMLFTFVGTTSDLSERTRIVPITVVIS